MNDEINQFGFHEVSNRELKLEHVAAARDGFLEALGLVCTDEHDDLVGRHRAAPNQGRESSRSAGHSTSVVFQPPSSLRALEPTG